MPKTAAPSASPAPHATLAQLVFPGRMIEGYLYHSPGIGSFIPGEGTAEDADHAMNTMVNALTSVVHSVQSSEYAR